MAENQIELTNATIPRFTGFFSSLANHALIKSDYSDDYLKFNNNTNGSEIDSHLAMILHRAYAELVKNEASGTLYTNHDIFPSSASMISASLVSFTKQTKSFRVFSFLSLWFVLIVNPLVILFGVTGNLLATYILIRCNIAKLPVSFYTIMLNISDTLNLLIPVFIFWLDNCFNRTPERGYFRDRSNFLCKALMCPDQLFATLSAWYMCAISFNRWYSVCRPSSYFFRTMSTSLLGSAVGSTNNTNNNNNNNANNNTNNTNSSGRSKKKHTSTDSSNGQPSSSFFIPFCFPVNCCSSLTRNTKFRQHLLAFRTIACMTLMGILFCLYPIFMHELRFFPSTNAIPIDLQRKRLNSYEVVWQRCYYSKKHEYVYDIIGIISSCFLHILPLTFVAAMNIMIIVRLKQRQYRMTVASHYFNSQTNAKKSKPLNGTPKKTSCQFQPLSQKIDHHKKTIIHSQSAIIISRKDQATSTDLSMQTMRLPSQPPTKLPNNRVPRRHHSRDRKITIMLVSVALSYLVLTLPYRLFWSYYVYVRRIHPERLRLSTYLLKMHYIDHVFRTIRNIHYGTNFVFFIFLSKTFRRKFRQIFIERLLQTINRIFHHNSTTTNIKHTFISKGSHLRPSHSKCEKPSTEKRSIHDNGIGMESVSRSIYDDIPSDIPIQEDEPFPIVILEHYDLSRSDIE